MTTYANCSLDLVGLSLVLVIFIYGRLNGRDRFEQFIFDALLWSNIILTVTDAMTWYLDGTHSPFLSFVFYVAQFICFLSAATIVLSWAFYCDWRLLGKTNTHKRYYCYLGYWLLFLIAMIFNIYFGFFFYIDQDYVYHRGDFYYIYVIYNALFLLYTLILTLRIAPTKDPVQRKDAYSLLLFMIPPAIGVLVQFLFFGVSIMPVSLSIALLFIFVHRLSALITTDNLTGLNNRRSFERNLAQRIAMHDAKDHLFLMMMDANNFKSINDQFGHKSGDEALVRISSAPKRSCRQGDILARIGGDEFVILGRRKTETEIEEFSSHIDEQLDIENEDANFPYRLSLSMGYAIFVPKKHPNATQFFEDADARMYEDKVRRKSLAPKEKTLNLPLES